MIMLGQNKCVMVIIKAWDMTSATEHSLKQNVVITYKKRTFYVQAKHVIKTNSAKPL
jgi:hypothetical protein